MTDIEKVKRKNRLKTKTIPPLIMLPAGAVATVIAWILKYDTEKLLIVVLITLLIFAIIGTVIKGVVDSFNMQMDYSDYFDEEGEIVEKQASRMDE
ncbi:MAG TPA: hypothetical protein PLZ77_01375 [Lachnospiraceae bacterium]|nr:hypothetical protein [Lachnospiraceae bacterium]HPF28735.1 hypothetical protein [Lachnospiraceae bacterium]